MNPGNAVAGRSRPIRVSVDRAAAASVPEVAYVLRTLLRTAGYSWVMDWNDRPGDFDIAYGAAPASGASVQIPRVEWPFNQVAELEPVGVERFGDVVIPRFAEERLDGARTNPAALAVPADVLFACYWWLSGARELTYRRDRADNLHVDANAVVRRSGLFASPCVSLTAAMLRRHFESQGIPARNPAWAPAGEGYSFSFSHDVDYPEIIRWIEVPRLLATRGRSGLGLAMDIARGRSHFWTFREWIELAKGYGTRPAFYFMARQGSLLQYALGTPDDFYDVDAGRFTPLFRELDECGAEVGLHASYHAHKSVAQLAQERAKIERVSGRTGIGNRHHYWHLDPADPNETLRRHEEAGLRYDSSLGFEFYPGYRRGICHPFRVFDGRARRELDIVQLPPAWMDDHFDRRLTENGITDPVRAARQLLDVAQQTRGTVVVNYHSRGMNERFYPRYGPWLARFLEEQVGVSTRFATPGEIVEDYRNLASLLESESHDRLGEDRPLHISPDRVLSITSMRHADIEPTAALHVRLFGDPAQNGHSVATLGPELLSDVFYRLNLDNDSFHCDVARVDGRVVGFSVYSTDRVRVFRHPVRHHLLGVVTTTARTMIRRPASIRSLLANLMYVRGERLPFLDGVAGWWIVAGVDPAFRTPDSELRNGGPIAARLFDRMEERLRAAGCPSWYGVVRPDNIAINKFLKRRGAREIGHASAQGLSMRYYVKEFDRRMPDAP